MNRKEIKTVQGLLIKFWDSGYSKVLGRFYGMINFILIISTYLILRGIEINVFLSITLFLVMVVVIFILGIFYVKLGFLGAEQVALYQENPEFMELRKEIKDIKELLKK